MLEPACLIAGWRSSYLFQASIKFYCFFLIHSPLSCSCLHTGALHLLWWSFFPDQIHFLIQVYTRLPLILSLHQFTIFRDIRYLQSLGTQTLFLLCSQHPLYHPLSFERGWWPLLCHSVVWVDYIEHKNWRMAWAVCFKDQPSIETASKGCWIWGPRQRGNSKLINSICPYINHFGESS